MWSKRDIPWFLREPRQDKDWTPETSLLPIVEVRDGGEVVTIRNIRNFRYRSSSDYDIDYYDRTYTLSGLHSVDFFVEPFSVPGPMNFIGGLAHTFVSFGFPQDYLTVSIEIRREKGQRYHPIKGLFRAYEIIYVFASERDVVSLRTNHRKNDVYLYPINTTREKISALFSSMISRASQLRNHPEFYNTLTNSCTTNLAKHVNAITPGRIPWRPHILLPGFSDRLLYRLGYIRTKRSFEETRELCKIDAQAAKFADHPKFSERIRESHDLLQ